MTDKKTEKLDALYNVLSGVDQTYNQLPLSMRLEIEKISRGLSEFGPRKLRKRGVGMEFFESREFRPDVDDPRRINARLSARAGKPIVIENEAEIRQHVYLWRDATGSMDYESDNVSYTKKQAAEIMLLSFAKHLSRNEEAVGILDRKGVFRGGSAADSLMGQLMDVAVIASDTPVLNRKFPRHSTVVLFSDFMTDSAALRKNLEALNGVDLKGYMVMVLDPQEIEFDFKGHIEFAGMEGEGTERFKKAESMRDAYQEKMKAHMRDVQHLCEAKGFKFILQRTDKPLYEGLLEIYGVSAATAPRRPDVGFTP